MLQPFNMEMLQPLKNRTNRRYNLPELYPPLPVFHISRIRSICTEKKLQELSMRLKIIFIFNTNHVKEHFSHLDS